jgi:hypothetical protein
MEFGINQIGKTTPQNVKNIRDSLLYFFMGALAFANLFAPRLHLTGEDYAMWIGFAMLLIKTGAKLWGVGDDGIVTPKNDEVKQNI